MIRPLSIEDAIAKYNSYAAAAGHNNKLNRRRTWRRILWEETDGRCAYCGQHTPSEQRTLEHVIPQALGGRWHVSNLMPACEFCNSRKPNSVSPVLYCKDLAMFFYVLTKEMTAHRNFSLTNRQSR